MAEFILYLFLPVVFGVMAVVLFLFGGWLIVRFARMFGYRGDE